MKMPRSHCENENVQFVQELAEVDGPFESPINLNFRDLAKLELPSLVWNHCEMAPKKMKITNTGHTVIISAKWKCERPFLTGGPLSGKYVFSQIHFHWGQDDCKGSEHQVCGEGFPLEMHVAHFKSEYLSQENALREKDGMVVIVYLFKLQEEPNAALKKILSCLPSVKQASTSQVIDPRPILSLCNPFTDDYFMYWGSVVTPTCAHILLWIICREPFGISRDQVNEFRKLCDATQQPIYRNNRDAQPLHKRNVFHVNASKNLDNPLLPIKKMMGCYCKGSEENIRKRSPANCGGQQPRLKNQEDIEGNIAEYKTGYGVRMCEDNRGSVEKVCLPQSFYVHQTFVVQRAAVKSAPQIPKWCGSEIKPQCSISKLYQTRSDGFPNFTNASRSCCFLSYKDAHKLTDPDGIQKIRRKKPLASLRALSHLMNSLEALKNHTIKKLKEIESINQEIKGMKPFCQDSKDKRWLRKVEKIMSRQKRFTIKTSKDCLGELKKLAKECNFDRPLDKKPIETIEAIKQTWTEVEEQALPCSDACKLENLDKTPSKPSVTDKVIKLSAKAQKLIQSFFEDIKESEELQQTVRKNIEMKKINSFATKRGVSGDSASNADLTKGFITQKMFNLGNLGDTFFAEVTSEDPLPEENDWDDKVVSNGVVVFEDENEQKKSGYNEQEAEKTGNSNVEEVKVCSAPSGNADESIPLHRANVSISLSKPSEKPEVKDNQLNNSTNEKKSDLPLLDGLSDTGSTSCSESFYTIDKKSKKKDYVNKSLEAYFRKQIDAVANYKLSKHLRANNLLANLHQSSSILTTDSTDTQRMIIAKFHKRQSRKDIWQEESSTVRKISSKALYGKTSSRKFRNKLRNINLEGYYIKKKNLKHKRKKNLKSESHIKRTQSSCERSSTSKDDIKTLMTKSKWKGLTKAKFKLKIKTSDSPLDSAIEYSFLSPERKKLKLESKKLKGTTPRSKALGERPQKYFPEEYPQTFDIPQKFVNTKNQENVNLYLLKGKGNDDENDGDDDDDDDDDGDDEQVSKTKKSNIDDLEVHPRNLLRIHIPRSSANESGANSRGSTKRTSRASSVDSKSTFSGRPDSIKLNTSGSPKIPINDGKKKTLGSFITLRNRSLTTLSTTTKDTCNEVNQRIFVESIELRRLTGRDTFDTRIIPDNSRREASPRTLTPRRVSRATSSENTKQSEGKVDQEISVQGFNFESYHSDHESESTNKVQQEDRNTKNPPLKRCDTEKYHFLDKTLDENSLSGQENAISEEKSRPESVQSDSGRGIKLDGPSMKGDAVTSTSDNKDLKTGVSYTTTKKNPQSRSHSAESLSSMKKVYKWKGKKRPHCCKKNSKHHIRKNSSLYKKLNKTENKAINFLGLTEEEQLKIITVNVAKYLEQKLVEGKTKYEQEEKAVLKETDTDVKNITVPIEKRPTSPVKSIELEEEMPVEKTVEKVVKQEKIPVLEHPKTEEIKEIKLEDTVKEKKLPPSPRPVHNFIKLNKLMAGKYKRSATPVDKTGENRNEQNKKKTTNEPPTQKTEKTKPKLIRKKKEKSIPQKIPEAFKNHEKTVTVQKAANKPNNVKGSRGIPSPILRKKEQQPKSRDKSAPPAAEKEARDLQKGKTESCPTETENPPASLVLKKSPQAKKRRVPAYMMTSYLPAPLEIIEKQQQKMNKFLLNSNPLSVKDYLSEVLNDTKQNKNRKNKKMRDTIISKELEYLIRLQMCLNNEISTNVENSMNYVKSMLRPDYHAPSIIETGPINETIDFYEPRKQGVVLIEMNNNFGCSSSNSDNGDDFDKYRLTKDTSNSKLKSKTKTANESGDSQMIDSTGINEFEVSEECNSDSGYNCEISITLNEGSVEGERDLSIYDSIVSKNSICELGDSQSYKGQNQILDSCSQASLKPHRKKRKENEISLEMKEKLLEILEAEIKREMEASYFVTENSSDTVTWKWEDTDLVNRSQSTESGNDNLEVLTQISETMRQYLTEFTERKLAGRNENSLDEETKSEDMS